MSCLRLFCHIPLWSLLALLFTALSVAEPVKRPLAPADFDGWREFHTPQLSRDGQWLAYSDMPQVDDGLVVARNLSSGQTWREPAGARPPAPFPPPVSPNPEDTPPPRQVRITLTSDSAFLVAGLFPTKAEQIDARTNKAKPEDQPKSPLLLLQLATGESLRVPAVKNFQVPARGGAWVAYLKESVPDPVVPPPVPEKRRWFQRKPATPPPPVAMPAPPKVVYGNDLVLRDLARGTEQVFPDVVEYAFARDGRTLLLAVSSRTDRRNGVYAVIPGEATPPRVLLSGPGRYSKLTWDRDQNQVVFLFAPNGEHQLPTAWHWQRAAAGATELKFTPPAPLHLSDKAAPTFSRDGRKVYFGAAPAPRKPTRPGKIDPEDVVSADLWSWHDDFVQPVQRTQAERERHRTYRGVLDLASRHYTQLADENLPEISVSDDGTRVLGFDNRPYRRLADFDGLYSDVYLVDAQSGARTRVMEKLRHGIGNRRGGPAFGWSPDGQGAAYYLDGHWHLLDTATGTTRNLTASLPVSFAQELHDTPEPAPAAGWAGWTSDNAAVLLYDRYDVWVLPVDGSAAVNVTRGDGRARRIVYRIQHTEPREADAEERGLDPTKPVILRGESETTRATGFFSSFSLGPRPAELLWGDKAYTYAGRALEADVLLLTASRFDEFPDLHTTNAEFDGLKKVTDGGAQLAPFLWGSAELMDFTNADGVPLQAAVYKPANFDPAKKYPMIVYIYERLSQIVHRFSPPAPSQNVNFPLYTSNGYIILTPDIVYTEGEPGPSALKAVLPAVDALVAQGFVDEDALGLQGHSWGGYQIAYMLTQTHRFRAAEAGAPVGNMTSAYGGIRWGAGIPRLFQYEQTQSRIGAPLTAATELYIANSPVFHAQNVQTPLLILHNDHDDAVPWQQGIELFLALRRHDKPVWFFNYHRGLHGLRRRADLKDFSQRMWQFFDHFLRGAPAPEWLEKGIPYLERESEKLRFNSLPAQDALTAPPIHD